MEKKRLKRMLQDGETTFRTDYQTGPLTAEAKTEFRTKSSCHRIRPSPLKDIQTMTDWKEPRVPFNLYWKEELDVDRSNPHVPQRPYSRPTDEEREYVQHTRPRLIMTPAVPLDAIEEPGRQKLMEEVYLSTSEYMMRQALSIANTKSRKLRVKAPLPEAYAPSKPLALGKLQPPLVPPEWRLPSAASDGAAARYHTAPTEEFWLRRGLRRD